MKKSVWVIILVIAIVLIVLWLKTQQKPANIAEVEETINATGENENNDKTDTNAEEKTEEVGTDLPIAEEGVAENDSDTVVEGATVYNITEWSVVNRWAKKVWGGHNWTVPVKQGTLLTNNNAVVWWDIVIDMNGLKILDTDSEWLYNHLKWKDFFDVENNPEANMKIKRLENNKVVAQLTMLWTTKTIAFPATIEINQDKVVVSSQFAIDRTLRWINGGLPAASKYIEITLNKITFTKQ